MVAILGVRELGQVVVQILLLQGQTGTHFGKKELSSVTATVRCCLIMLRSLETGCLCVRCCSKETRSL